MRVYGEDHGWARRGSMENAWTDTVGYIRKGEQLDDYVKEITQRLENAEDGTPDKEFFDQIRNTVELISKPFCQEAEDAKQRIVLRH